MTFTKLSGIAFGVIGGDSTDKTHTNTTSNSRCGMGGISRRFIQLAILHILMTNGMLSYDMLCRPRFRILWTDVMKDEKKRS